MTALPPYQKRAPWLILAPHLRYPTRNGADILVDRTARYLSRHVQHVDLLAEDRGIRFERGRRTDEAGFDNQMRSRAGAGLRTLLRDSHFLREKFNTPRFEAEARSALALPEYGTVLYSYLSTALLRTNEGPADRLHLVATHNDEVRWFADRAKHGRLLSRAVANQSREWLESKLPDLADDFGFLHVTEADQAGYEHLMPGHDGFVVPVGADPPQQATPPRDPGMPPSLLFVGSLGVRMNADALVHFARRFAPQMPDAARVVVAGSRPSPEVQTLCARNGWELHPDVSDDELDALYAGTAFAILPFAYATGAKLKLMGALARGVPVLSTLAASTGHESLPSPCMISDAPSDWRAALERVATGGISASERGRISAAAEPYLWPAIISSFVDTLERS